MAAEDQEWIEADQDGIYFVQAQVRWGLSGVDKHHRIWLVKDDGSSPYTIGSNSILSPAILTDFYQQVSAVIDLLAGDKLELWCRHNSSGGVTIEGGLDTGGVHPVTWMAAWRINA
jgi:hypothetical protein